MENEDDAFTLNFFISDLFPSAQSPADKALGNGKLTADSEMAS